MKETYQEMTQRHQTEFNNFPSACAITDKYLPEALAKLNATEEEVYHVGYGLLIRKKDAPKFNSMMRKHDKEKEEAIKDYDFLKSMFIYELGNHEYCITYDYTDTLMACGFTGSEVMNNKTVRKALAEATEEYLRGCDEW